MSYPYDNSFYDDPLGRRKDLGEKCLRLVHGNPVHPEDRESAASDAISDILTAMYGPAGTTVESDGRYQVVLNGKTLDKARELLDHALRSYEGDAEDYEAD